MNKRGSAPALLWSFAATVAVAIAACADPSSLVEAEAAVLRDILGRWCEGDRPVIVEDSLGGEVVDGGFLDFLRRETGQDLPRSLEASFVGRNREAATLRSLVDPVGQCTYMDPATFAAFLDTAAIFESDWWPGLEPDSQGLAPEVTPSVIRLSRVGFDGDLQRALVSLSWSGGFGFCWSDYVLMRQGPTGWTIDVRVQYIVC